jgi:hypothetical protein
MDREPCRINIAAAHRDLSKSDRRYAVVFDSELSFCPKWGVSPTLFHLVVDTMMLKINSPDFF